MCVPLGVDHLIFFDFLLLFVLEMDFPVVESRCVVLVIQLALY
jgi:hypothetical protein